jgi:hypothetical protein
MLGSEVRNYEMFSKLCGDDAASCIILVTTRWDLLGSLEQGEQREEELREAFWNNFISRGSTTARYSKEDDSASNIINTIIERNHSLRYILIQRELVDLHKILPETQAGKAVRYSLEELITTIEKEVRQLRKGRRTADAEQRQTLAETEERLRQVLAQVDELRVPLGRRIRKLFGLL